MRKKRNQRKRGKIRSKYKVCGRLGYNAMLRRWYGTKKKWRRKGRFDPESVEKRKVVNPVYRLLNEDRRRGGTHPTRVRRKDTHAKILNQRTGRKRRYGGVKRQAIRTHLKEQRRSYKELKGKNERRYRKGRRRGRSDGVREMESLGMKEIHIQKQPSHRRGRTELRVDRRRWRSGRVPTVQMARDVIGHGGVVHRDGSGKVGESVKWSSIQVQIGHGRKLNEKVWKKRKGRSRALLEKKDYLKTPSRYREVDYVTGTRVVLRKAESTERVVPKGRDRSNWKMM